MNGLEVTVLRLSKVLAEDSNLRIESEYFRKIYLQIDKQISKHGFSYLGSLTKKISDGTHFTPDYTETGVPFLSAINVKENYLDINGNYKFISDKEHSELYRRCDPTEKDILLRKVGVGARMACVVPEHIFDFSIFVSVAQIRCELDALNPYYLSTFINSKLGQLQLLRFNKGISQPDLHLEEIRRLKVPCLSAAFQNRVEELIRSAYIQAKDDKRLFLQADEIFLKTVGFDNWTPPNESRAIKSFGESFIETGRLDAEFYSPKYDYAIEKLNELKPKTLVPLGNLLEEITNGQTPLRHDLSEGDVVFLTAEHISDFRIDFGSDKRIETEHHQKQLAKTAIKKNDVLITIKGKIGNAAVVEEVPSPTNINQDVGLLRLKDGIDSYYIAGYINSILGKMFTKRISTGQINPFLGLGNLRTIPVPIFDNADELGQDIKQKVIEAKEASSKSKHLLETAKRAVEIAIEQNEQAAMDFIAAATD